jgi:hypothetical protein
MTSPMPFQTRHRAGRGTPGPRPVFRGAHPHGVLTELGRLALIVLAVGVVSGLLLGWALVRVMSP